MGLTRESFAEEVRLERIRQTGRRAGCSGGGECGSCQGLQAASAEGLYSAGKRRGTEALKGLRAPSAPSLHPRPARRPRQPLRALAPPQLPARNPAHSPHAARERGWGGFLPSISPRSTGPQLPLWVMGRQTESARGEATCQGHLVRPCYKQGTTHVLALVPRHVPSGAVGFFVCLFLKLRTGPGTWPTLRPLERGRGGHRFLQGSDAVASPGAAGADELENGRTPREPVRDRGR